MEVRIKKGLHFFLSGGYSQSVTRLITSIFQDKSAMEMEDVRIWRNSDVLHGIFKFLPLADLNTMSLVCKKLNLEARSYMQFHRECFITIKGMSTYIQIP